jgi:hypothetical protein
MVLLAKMERMAFLALLEHQGNLVRRVTKDQLVMTSRRN